MECLILGIGAGVGLVFLYEFLDRSFLNVQEASHFLGVPMLGAISQINTVESLFEAKERNKWRLFWMGSLGTLSVVFTIMIHAFIKP
jgi:hypothetical protein